MWKNNISKKKFEDCPSLQIEVNKISKNEKEIL